MQVYTYNSCDINLKCIKQDKINDIRTKKKLWSPDSYNDIIA